jgi:hypothetical protein
VSPSLVFLTKKKKEAQLETAEMNSFKNVAGSTRKDQIRNTKIKEELIIFNLHNQFLKFRSQREYHILRM